MFKDDDEEEDNTFGVTRYPCMPSLVALQQMRNRLHLANLGKKLMKWTALATCSELRNIAGRLDKIYQSFSEDMRNAYILLARCRYFYPNLNKMVIEGCPKVVEISLLASTRTAAGVKIVKYDVIENKTRPYAHLGIEKGGQTILDTKKAWLELLKRIIKMVELRTNFTLVENMYKAANKKWNVLSKMVIPRISLSTRYILSELEEIEREDNFRLKRFKELKTKKKRKDLIDTCDIQKQNKTVIHRKLVGSETNDILMQQEDGNKYNEKKMDEKCNFCLNFPTGEHKKCLVAVEDQLSKNYFQDIISHADEIINLSKRNDSCNAKVVAIKDELKVILDKLLMDRECEYCKNGTQVKDKKIYHHTHRSDDNFANTSALGSEISIPQSIFNMKSEDKEQLGHYKKKYKESLEVLRLQNEDGTIREKKKKVIVKTNTRNPIKAKILEGKEESSKQNSHRSCFKFDSESEDSIKEFNNPQQKSFYYRNDNRFHTEGKDINNIHSNTKSEPACCNTRMAKAKLRQCVSTDDIKRTSNSDVIICCCPSDISINLTLQSSSSDKLQNTSINRLPFISSMYLNVCNLQKNMCRDFTQDKNLYDNHNFHERNKGTLHNCYEKANEIVSKANFEDIGICNFGLISEKIVDENYRSSNTEKNEKDAANNILTKAADISYMFKNIINAINKGNQNSVVHEKYCLELPKFTYIFSKISEDKGLLEDSFVIIHALLTESYSYKSLYPCTSYWYKRIDIESIIKNACLHVVHFPYLFSQCISAGSAKETTKLDAESYCYPDDITFNLTFQGRNCDNLQNINITQIPIASTVNVNLFYLPWNIFQKLTDVNYNYVNENGKVQKKLRSYSQTTSSHLRMSKETTGTNTRNIDSTSTNENVFNNSYQALNNENAEIQAIAVCASSNIGDMNYIFNGTNQKSACNTVQKTTCLQFPEFAYLFSKINDVKDHAEDSFKTINIPFKGFYNNATKFPYIFSSYKRMEIETLLKNACTYVVSFPYLFTNVKNKREENIQDDVKLTNINILLSDDYKLTKCSYVVTEESESSHIQISNNLVKINNVLQYESYDKKYLPYIGNKAEDKKSIDLLKQESKNYNLILDCSKSNSNTKCYLNHTMDEVCKNEAHNKLSYIFSKVKSYRSWNELNLSQNMSIIESECFTNNNDQSVTPSDVPFTNSKGDHKNIENKFSLQFVIENIDVRRYVITNFTYIFSKVSKSRTFIKLSNDLDIDVLYKDTCIHNYDFPYIFKKLDHIDFTKNLNPVDIRYQEIDKLFKDYCKRNPIVNSVFKYILENVELKSNNQDNFVYIFSNVKELRSNSDETKCLNDIKNVLVKNSTHDFQKEVRSHEWHDHNLNSHEFNKLDANVYEKVNNIKSNIPKCGVNNDTTNFTYMFDKVLKSSPFMYDLNYIEIDAVNDLCEFPYLFNKTAQSSLYKEINKLFKDSCEIDIDLKLKYDYLFQKVPKLHDRQIETFNCNNKYTKESIQQASLSCFSFIDYGMKSLSTTSNQSQRILVQLPRSKSGSSCSEFVLMLKTSYSSDKKPSLTSQSDIVKSLLFSKSCCNVNIESTNDQYMIKSKSFHNQENVTQDIVLNAAKEVSMKDQENISLIKRMLDTVKNVYVPLDTSITSQKTKECFSKINNLNSILLNSTSSSYSWKSCVMKTCQRETEDEEDLSYSAFSFESSLDYVSYKSEDTESDKNGCNGVVGNNAPVGDKRVLFDIETSLGSFVFNKDSCSLKENNPCTATLNSTCLPNMETKESSKILCGRVSSILDRPNHYYNLKQESSNSSCSHNFQFNKSVGETSQLNVEYYCNICKQRKNIAETTVEYSNNPTPYSLNSSVQNSLLLDLDKCCCHKKF